MLATKSPLPLLLVILLVLLLVPEPGAQSSAPLPNPLPSSKARKVEGAPYRVRADPTGVDEEGNVTWDYRILGRRAPGSSSASVVPPPAKALVKSFGSNTTTSGFFSVGTTGTEWVNWACKNGRKSELFGAFVAVHAYLVDGVIAGDLQEVLAVRLRHEREGAQRSRRNRRLDGCLVLLGDDRLLQPGDSGRGAG